MSTASSSTRPASCLTDGRGETVRQSMQFFQLTHSSKLTSTILSTFSNYYIWLWPKYFPDKPLSPPLPTFDGRAVCYPTVKTFRDYMSWRQADCNMVPIHTHQRLGKLLITAGHINNLFNTTFWALILQGGMNNQQAEKALAVCHLSPSYLLLCAESGPGNRVSRQERDSFFQIRYQLQQRA